MKTNDDFTKIYLKRDIEDLGLINEIDRLTQEYGQTSLIRWVHDYPLLHELNRVLREAIDA